jgi:cAMP phosphodiesterase
MRKWLGKIECDDIMSKCSLEEMWSKFCEKIQQATEKFVPVIKGKSRHYPKWMN